MKETENMDSQLELGLVVQARDSSYTHTSILEPDELFTTG